MSAKVELLNVDDIMKNFDELIKTNATTLEEGLQEVGQRGVGIVKEETAVVSGRLRNSMSYTFNNRVYEGGEDELNPSPKKDEVIIGTNVIYAPRVEYLATNGSAGFMLRSYNQLKPIAEAIFKTLLGRKFK